MPLPDFSKTGFLGGIVAAKDQAQIDKEFEQITEDRTLSLRKKAMEVEEFEEDAPLRDLRDKVETVDLEIEQELQPLARKAKKGELENKIKMDELAVNAEKIEFDSRVLYNIQSQEAYDSTWDQIPSDTKIELGLTGDFEADQPTLARRISAGVNTVDHIRDLQTAAAKAVGGAEGKLKTVQVNNAKLGDMRFRLGSQDWYKNLSNEDQRASAAYLLAAKDDIKEQFRVQGVQIPDSQIMTELLLMAKQSYTKGGLWGLQDGEFDADRFNQMVTQKYGVGVSSKASNWYNSIEVSENGDWRVKPPEGYFTEEDLAAVKPKTPTETPPAEIKLTETEKKEITKYKSVLDKFRKDQNIPPEITDWQLLQRAKELDAPELRGTTQAGTSTTKGRGGRGGKAPKSTKRVRGGRKPAEIIDDEIPIEVDYSRVGRGRGGKE